LYLSHVMYSILCHLFLCIDACDGHVFTAPVLKTLQIIFDQTKWPLYHMYLLYIANTLWMYANTRTGLLQNFFLYFNRRLFNHEFALIRFVTSYRYLAWWYKLLSRIKCFILYALVAAFYADDIVNNSLPIKMLLYSDHRDEQRQLMGVTSEYVFIRGGRLFLPREFCDVLEVLICYFVRFIDESIARF